MLTTLIEYETPKVVTVHNLSIGETSSVVIIIMRLRILHILVFTRGKGVNQISVIIS